MADDAQELNISVGDPASIAPWARRDLYWLGAALILFMLAFSDAIGNLVFRWNQNEEFSHGFFIPVISLWFVWQRRDLLAALPRDPQPLGLAIVLLSVLMLISGQLTYIFIVQHVGLVTGLVGMVLAFGGPQHLRLMAIPLFYLVFMIPLPYFANYLLTSQMQFLASEIGVAFIRLIGIPAHLSGNVIDLGDFKLAVVEACSGLRYLFPFVSLGFLAAYLFRGPIWQKVLLLGSTVPITILMNSFRIAMTAFFSSHLGTDYAEGFSHFFEGWMVFILCGLALFGIGALLTILVNKKPLNGSFDAPEVQVSTAGNIDRSKPWIARTAVGAMVVSTVLVVGYIGTDNLIIPDRQELVTLPYRVNDWRLRKIHELDQDVEAALAADDYLIADFVRPNDGVVNLYVAYLGAQRDGRSWHSPRQCLPGGGWKIERINDHSVMDANGNSFAVNRAIISQGRQRQLVYYWFEQRGRRITNEFAVKFYVIADTLTRARSDGSLVRLITPLEKGEDVEAGDRRLQRFSTELLKTLPDYVPS